MDDIGITRLTTINKGHDIIDVLVVLIKMGFKSGKMLYAFVIKYVFSGQINLLTNHAPVPENTYL